ncbi:glycosyltransferase [Candidatus Uhrbacteria bacterium]|nr:glycosyltransferase [Candidatus Uhrbacteria bacterium]
MKVSFVIVSWNVRELLERCLRSIFDHSADMPHEVIVIDNASVDGSSAMVAEKFGQVKLIANKENRGFAAACNQGIEHSTGEYVFLLNPDSEITKSTVSVLTAYLDMRTDVGIVAPQIQNADGSIQQSIQRFPTPLSQLGVLFKIRKVAPRPLANYYADDFDYTRDEQQVEQPDGAALLIRRSALETVGTFDERFFLWFDEVDLCKRVYDAGYKTVYLSRTHVVHHSGKSFAQKGILEKQRLFFTSCARYLKKHCGATGLLAAGVMNSVVGVCAIMDAAVSLIRQGKQARALYPVPVLSHQKRLFIGSLCAIIAVELFSLGGYFYGPIDSLTLGFIAAATLLITYRRPEYGVAILFAELIIGSKGYLFSMMAGDMRLSARMVLFGAVFAGWLLYVIDNLPRKDSRESLVTLRHASLRGWYALLCVAVFIGIVQAIRNGNGAGYIFADANAWFFFLILPVLYDALRHREQIIRFLTIGAAALSASLIKVLVIFYMMGHRGFGDDILTVVYRWIRSTGVGELTQMDSLYRIFFQSQMYVVLLFFILISYIAWFARFSIRDIAKRYMWLGVLLVGSIASLILSFSRSFWLGVFVMVVLFSAGIFGLIKNEPKAVVRFFGIGAGGIFCALLTLFAISVIPFPSRDGVFSVDLLTERVEDIESEAAAASRWNLLPIMLDEIKKAPLLGHGFGKTLTYTSRDPRVLLQNESGTYTTYAFEWGYFDLWLKLGLLGLLAYLFLLAAICIRGADTMRTLFQKGRAHEATLMRGLLYGMGALSVIHFFTPYLNHPLGIGIVMIVAVLSERLDSIHS